jgi:peptidoglycan/LPS O-acetylase OafA/YrhL
VSTAFHVRLITPLTDDHHPPEQAARVNQVDAMKALAILFVLIDHSLNEQILYSAWAPLHDWQAVPVFMVLIGFAGQWGTVYRRVVRVLVPFAILWLASLVVALIIGQQPVGWMSLVGYLPVTGPGNFFVPIVLCLSLLLPVFRWLAGRSMLLLVVALGLADLAFELAAPHIPLFAEGHPYLYSAAFPRYLLAVGLGFWLVTRPRLRWVVSLGLASLAYIVGSRLTGWRPPFLPDWGTDNLLASGYPAMLVAVGLRYLPAKIPAAVSLIGRATYHIFLAQILFFAEIRYFAMGWRLVMGLTIPFVIGILWFVLERPLLTWLATRRMSTATSNA